MINEQLELIELESMLGSVDPVHVQHIEWVKNNGMIVALLVAVGSLIAFIGAWFLRKLNRKGMLFQIIGASLVIAAMILLMNVHPLIASILVAVQLLLMLVTVINRSKLN
jgi:CHASE2 domain-containing sensor protein